MIVRVPLKCLQACAWCGCRGWQYVMPDAVAGVQGRRYWRHDEGGAQQTMSKFEPEGCKLVGLTRCSLSEKVPAHGCMQKEACAAACRPSAYTCARKEDTPIYSPSPRPHKHANTPGKTTPPPPTHMHTRMHTLRDRRARTGRKRKCMEPCFQGRNLKGLLPWSL